MVLLFNTSKYLTNTMHQRDQLSNVARTTYMLNNELGKHHILNNTGEQGTF